MDQDKVVLGRQLVLPLLLIYWSLWDPQHKLKGGAELLSGPNTFSTPSRTTGSRAKKKEEDEFI